MAAVGSSDQQNHDGNGTKRELVDLYERVREATWEAQRQGDAQLRAAIAAATAVPNDIVRICPLSLTFSNTGLERAYWRKSSSSSDKRDVIPFVFLFLLRLCSIWLLLQTGGSHVTAGLEKEMLPRLVSHLLVAAICAVMLVVYFHYSGWYQCNRCAILSVASLLWFGEAVTVFASRSVSTFDRTMTVVQCIFMSILHRVPFSLHLKMRLVGFGLLVSSTLTMEPGTQKAVSAILYISMSHFLGVALAYVLDQQSRVGFLKSFPSFLPDKISGDPDVCSQQPPKRALGGFAGGFAGVSGLKCPNPPAPILTISSSNHSGPVREDYVSEVSCSSSSTVENGVTNSSTHHYFTCWSFSNKDPIEVSDTLSSSKF